MPQIDVNKIVAEARKLYSKDKKANTIVATGAEIKTEYAEI